jgi:hypothetical protein
MTVKAMTLKSGRKAAHPRKVVAKKASIKVQKAEKPVAEIETSPENLETRIESIPELKIIDEKAPPMDLKNIDNNMTLSLYAINEMGNNVANLEKEFHILGTYAKIFIGLGAMGFLTLLYYALWSMQVIK